MSVASERKLERLTEILDKLSAKIVLGTPVLVEGKKDVQALRRLNILGTMITIKDSGKVLEDLLYEFQGPEVIAFVDFDKHGTELTKEILCHMERRRIRVNTVFWRKTRALVRRDVKDVEGLPSYLERLKKKTT